MGTSGKLYTGTHRGALRMMNYLAVSIFTCIISLFSACHDSAPTVTHMYTRGEVITETLVLQSFSQQVTAKDTSTITMSFTNSGKQTLQYTFVARTDDISFDALMALLHKPVMYSGTVVSSADGLTVIDNVSLVDVELTISE